MKSMGNFITRAVPLVSALLLAGSQARTPGQVFQELYSFAANGDGLDPEAAPVQAKDGNFYGTTMEGPSLGGCGTVYRISVCGEFTTLAVFNDTNGCWPYGALIQASDGNFYGTTLYGRGTLGSVFRVTPSGTITTLAWFGGVGGANSGSPNGDLVEGPDHKLYGTTLGGGYDLGTIFRISTNGDLETLHSFGGREGYYPNGGLLLASDGNFYGVTVGGDGTVYQMTPQGVVSLVAGFPAGPYGASWPSGKLLQAPDGTFYGTASTTARGGAIFRLTPANTLETFCSSSSYYLGESIAAPIVLAPDGNFYGACNSGGEVFGTIFKVTPEGVGSVLFNFYYDVPGSSPYAGLALGSDGNLYGTAAIGGSRGGGNIFRINMPGPKLTASKFGADLILSWRTNYTGYTLQWTADPVRGTWTECSNSISTSGSQHFVTNSVSGPQRFFRLSRPTR